METNQPQYPTLRTRIALTLILLAALFAAGISSVMFVSFRNELVGINMAPETILVKEREYLIQLMLIFLGSIPFIIAAGIAVANYLAKPIVQLRNATKRISEGDYSVKIENTARTRELVELAADFNGMSDRLSGLINDLEKRVAERTESLVRKSDQLRAAAHISRQTADVQDLDSLLDMVAKLISEQYDFYHTGIFMVSESGDEAILQAASSDGGRRMLERGYSLAIGKQGLVGTVARDKKLRIALDVGPNAIFFNNPDLPMTRSELALPMLIRNKVLGVLDIHSDKPMDFTPDDTDVLQTLADQVAVAVENAKLLEEAKATLSQLEALTTVRTRDAWSQKLHGKRRAYTYTPLGLRAEKLAPPGNNHVTIPLTLRGQKIGSISVTRKGNATISKSDEEMIVEVASQAGLAIDNIRLLEEATARARQEQIVGKLAGRFNQSLDVDTLLQTAARELAQLPDVAEVSVFIGKQTSEINPRQKNRRNAG